MTGHLQIKRNKYYVVLDRYIDGKRRQQWLSTGLTAKGNKRKAEQMLRERLVQEAQKAPLPALRMPGAGRKITFAAGGRKNR